MQRPGIRDNGTSDIFHLADGGQLAEPALNPGNTNGEVSERWRRNSPKIVVIDDFLTNEALDSLRRFCWGSTVWRKIYKGGYLGAFPELGFASPLLFQIADELRRRYPIVFASHPLTQLWAFKYDSQLPGIGLHADFAAINVNFWITPDDANLDPKSGGLVIWDKAAPLDWDFAKYNNTDTTAARFEFLAHAGARSVTVPYRSNRAVIFDSDLFHETDRIVFKDRLSQPSDQHHATLWSALGCLNIVFASISGASAGAAARKGALYVCADPLVVTPPGSHQ